MIVKNGHDFPENHPLRKLFRSLTDRALAQSQLPDKDIYAYLTNLLVDFIFIENFLSRNSSGQRLTYLIDMLEKARCEGLRARERKQALKHIGDYSMFTLGMFPESLRRGRRAIPESYYADTGRYCYIAASELEQKTERCVVFRKLADRYDRCVLTLNWVRAYTSDPFYQYMFRQFRIT